MQLQIGQIGVCQWFYDTYVLDVILATVQINLIMIADVWIARISAH